MDYVAEVTIDGKRVICLISKCCGSLDYILYPPKCSSQTKDLRNADLFAGKEAIKKNFGLGPNTQDVVETI